MSLQAKQYKHQRPGDTLTLILLYMFKGLVHGWSAVTHYIVLNFNRNCNYSQCHSFARKGEDPDGLERTMCFKG